MQRIEPIEPQPGVAPLHAMNEAEVARVTRIVAMCHARMRSPLENAEFDDAVQDVLIAVWRQQSPFRGESRVESWIYGVARTVIVRRMVRQRELVRRGTCHGFDVPDPIDEHPGPGSGVDSGLCRSVRAGLLNSGTTVAKIMVARCIEGRSFESIGIDLGRHVAAVRARYYRALPRLRERLAEAWRDVR